MNKFNKILFSSALFLFFMPSVFANDSLNNEIKKTFEKDISIDGDFSLGVNLNNYNTLSLGADYSIKKVDDNYFGSEYVKVFFDSKEIVKEDKYFPKLKISFSGREDFYFDKKNNTIYYEIKDLMLDADSEYKKQIEGVFELFKFLEGNTIKFNIEEFYAVLSKYGFDSADLLDNYYNIEVFLKILNSLEDSGIIKITKEGYLNYKITLNDDSKKIQISELEDIIDIFAGLMIVPEREVLSIKKQLNSEFNNLAFQNVYDQVTKDFDFEVNIKIDPYFGVNGLSFNIGYINKEFNVDFNIQGKTTFVAERNNIVFPDEAKSNIVNINKFIMAFEDVIYNDFFFYNNDPYYDDYYYEDNYYIDDADFNEYVEVPAMQKGNSFHKTVYGESGIKEKNKINNVNNNSSANTIGGFYGI